MPPSRRVAFATSSAYPDSPEDDRHAIEALHARDVEGVPTVWSSPSIRWSDFAMVIVRSTWDYPSREAEFLEWVDRVSRATSLWNPAPMLRWNLDKGYLLDLERQGFDIVPTERVAQGSATTLRSILETRGWDDVIVKPAVGAAGLGLKRIEPAALGEGETHLADLLKTRDALVQPFQSAGQTLGERSLVFVDGAFSHAVGYPSVMASFDKLPRPLVLTEGELEPARRLVARLRPRPLYARVDQLPAEDGRWRLGELELIEPELFFRSDREAAGRFADAVERRLAGSARS